MTALASPAAEPRGWPLLPVPDDAGELRYPDLDESVRQQIRVILTTRPGEQLMRPDYGAGLDDYAHEPNTLTTRRRIRDAVHGALGRWEPRILLDRVEVWEVDDRPGEVRVEIGYRLRRTGAARKLGVVLELAAEG
ncbi:MAG TPA: GPW/gp25 family protein [Longimicrobium sp.]|nr:GPW/gp25 family protein [Longimicrobium sp.]